MQLLKRRECVMWACAGKAKTHPVDVDLFLFGKQLRRDDVFKSEEDLQTGDVAITVTVLLQKKTSITIFNLKD